MSQLCECGCGEPTPPAKRTSAKYGCVKGEPLRFIPAHSGRAHKGKPGPRWIEENRGYKTPCWIWQLSTIRGYGRTRDKTNGNKGRFAHRVIYEERYGPVPEGLQLDHLCRVRACVNPDHLEPVTCATNIRRGANAKLTMEAAEAIRADDRPYREIAADYGVSISAICDVRRGRKWVAA